ncbi:MAG TPA: RagB/SusD family nutrient uptake outer membrane protein [Longimicrobiales bacterium]|nr:RagB/SusD family nutrient uptake outer membrane protein [Longimicrobiales bacterium]
MTTRSFAKLGVVVAAIIGLAACKDMLTVTDPDRYTSEDLDGALPAVANGVEGAVHEVIDTYVVYQSLLSDIYEHTGTWSGYDEVDHGRFIYGASAMDGTMNALLRARWFAGDAEERFKRVLGEEEAATSPLTAQVRLAGAMVDLYLGSAWCEAPAVADGPAVSDMELLQQAVTKFTATIQIATTAGETDIVTAAIAGRARANLLLGKFGEAAADAGQVPDGFSYDAKFNNQSSNWVVTVTTATFNEAAGLRRKWWPLVDDDAGGPTFMRDPYTNELDRRKPVHWDGDRATDNVTPHYSQWKYTLESDDIPMVHADEMRLIEAEVLMRGGDYDGAMAIINELRANVGLSPIAVPTTEAAMVEILLSERDAEMFMEGMRPVDLWRFGLTKQVFEAMADPERPAVGRPIKFSMSDSEALLNNQIADDLAQRCLPRTN